MGLAARARRLEMVRSVGVARAQSLVWTSPQPGAVSIDAAALPEGARIVRDYTVRRYRPGDVDEATWCERIAHDAGDAGFVFAWDGRVVGSVSAAGLLSYTWPEDLAPSPPGVAPDRDELLEVARAAKAIDDARVAAELADAERSRRQSSK